MGARVGAAAVLEGGDRRLWGSPLSVMMVVIAAGVLGSRWSSRTLIVVVSH